MSAAASAAEAASCMMAVNAAHSASVTAGHEPALIYGLSLGGAVNEARMVGSLLKISMRRRPSTTLLEETEDCACVPALSVRSVRRRATSGESERRVRVKRSRL